MKTKKKLKRNKYQQCVDAELDLHGYYQDEAAEALLAFLGSSEARGCGRVRIITGKGLHSQDGIGVLRNLAEDILRNLGYEYTEAKINEGGGGVLVVKL